jgi:hypothetical protein
MYYLYLCICTSAKCMSVELKVYLFIWSLNFRFSMSLSLSPNSLYSQTTNCTEGGGLTREHCTFILEYTPYRESVIITLLTYLNENELSLHSNLKWNVDEYIYIFSNFYLSIFMNTSYMYLGVKWASKL